MESDMESRKQAIKDSIRRSINSAEFDSEPYNHWVLKEFFPQEVFVALKDLPFEAPELGGVSGTREVHNATRVYFDKDNQRDHAVCKAVSDVLQDPEIVASFTEKFGGKLSQTFLRIEYAQDTDGFWLEPHTDIGVKNFTMLAYLSDDPQHADLGTDIYSDANTHFGRPPFEPNSCLVFIPADDTWHGFEAREIVGVRKSIIVNYVTDEWRAREQLAFPEVPVQ